MNPATADEKVPEGGLLDGRVMGEEGEGRALRVALVSLPAMGHVLPLCCLARELSRRGHRVALYSVDAFQEKLSPLVEACGAMYRPIPTSYAHLSAAEAEEAVLGGGPGRRLSELVREMATSLTECWTTTGADDDGDDDERPDVAVVDFLTCSGVTAAQRCGVPLVINLPGPVAMLRQLMCLPDPSSAITGLGVTVVRHPWSMIRLLSRLAPVYRVLVSGVRSAAGRCPVLVNSFRGLERPALLPHNWILTGPLSQPPTQLVRELASSHPQLFAWLEAAIVAERPVVYVSTGSLQKLGAWEVATLAAGLARSGAAVAWSLPTDSQAFLPDDLVHKDDSFWVSTWLPQPAILAHPATKLVVTHCGWGGTLEVIAAAQPVVALPFKADQPLNAALLVSAGCGVMLPEKRRFGALFDKVEGLQYGPGDYSAESVADKVTHVLRNYATFKAAATRLQQQAAFTRGANEAADCIEWVGRAGVENSSSVWDNPALRRFQGGWVELLMWPALGIGAAAVATCWLAGKYASAASRTS